MLTSLIFLAENECLGHSVDFSNIWNFIPMPSAETIVMLCYNALKMHIINPATLSNVPSNIVLVEYGFQVRHVLLFHCSAKQCQNDSVTAIYCD